MATTFYAIELEPGRLIAAEIDDQGAASLLDSGRSVILANKKELEELAQRLSRPLFLWGRDSRPAPRRGQAAPVPDGRELPKLSPAHATSTSNPRGSAKRAVALRDTMRLWLRLRTA